MDNILAKQAPQQTTYSLLDYEVQSRANYAQHCQPAPSRLCWNSGKSPVRKTLTVATCCYCAGAIGFKALLDTFATMWTRGSTTSAMS